MTTEEKKNVKKWTPAHEKLFIEWADKALCYKWLHSKSNLVYDRLNTLYTIPVIVMSTLTGTANFAQDKFPENLKGYVPVGIGLVNIAAGIITTIQQFLGISEMNEAYRVAALSWDKFYRKIKVELSKHPNERVDVEVFLKSSADEFDRLMEISPAISNKITEEFKKTFEGKIKRGKDGKEILTDKQKAFRKLKKPEICDSLETTFNSVYKFSDNVNDFLNIDGRIDDLIKKKDALMKKYTEIQEFIDGFHKEFERIPTEEEIVENFIEDTSNDIDKTTIINFIKLYTIKENQNLSVKISRDDDDVVNDIDNELNEKLNKAAKKRKAEQVNVKIDK